MPGKWTQGTVDATACPWCGKANDFSGIKDYGLDLGNTIICDHCSRKSKIKRVQPVTMIWLERV